MHFPQKPLKSFKKALRGSRGTSCRHGSSSGLRIPGRGLRREENMWHTDSRLLRLLAKKEGFIQTPRPAPSSTQAAGSAPGGTFRSGEPCRPCGPHRRPQFSPGPGRRLPPRPARGSPGPALPQGAALTRGAPGSPLRAAAPHNEPQREGPRDAPGGPGRRSAPAPAPSVPGPGPRDLRPRPRGLGSRPGRGPPPATWRYRHSPRSRPASPRAPQRLAAMLELVRHGLRQWKERAGGGDPGGGAAEGDAEAGEVAAEPRGARRGAGCGRTGRAELSPAAGTARKEPERLGEGAPAPSSSSAALRPPPPLPSAEPGLAGRSTVCEGRAARRQRLRPSPLAAIGAAARPTARETASRWVGTVLQTAPGAAAAGLGVWNELKRKLSCRKMSLILTCVSALPFKSRQFAIETEAFLL